MDDQQASTLFNKYLAGHCNAGEVDRLFEYIGDGYHESAVKSWIAEALTRESVGHMGQLDTIYNNIQREIAAKRAGRVRVLWTGWMKAGMAAAALVLVIVGGWELWRGMQKGSVVMAPAVVTRPVKPANDALPGHSGAILTLADGTSKVLDSIPDGQVARQGASMASMKGGQLSYAATKETAGKEGGAGSEPVAYNMVSTPRGRQFQLVLPDGTKVWLNAASSIRYPTAFTGKKREVEITGEAYLEVSRNVGQPFFVNVHGTENIEVLGTSFNINSYSDEQSIATTLIDGAVKVVAMVGTERESKILQPGEQARLSGGSGRLVTKNHVDVKQVVAWKNGAFSFSDADLSTVMRQLGRWYNVEVEFPDGVPAGRFAGEIGRDLTLAEVLRVLTKTSIHFKIENGSKIIILPN